MTEADALQFVGTLFGAWVIGYLSGLFFYAIKRTIDFI